MPTPVREPLCLEPLESRETPSVETFDSLAPPTLPSGWSEFSSDGSTVFATAAGKGESGSAGLVSSGGSRTGGLAWNGTSVSGDTGAAADINLTSLVPTFVFAAVRISTARRRATSPLRSRAARP